MKFLQRLLLSLPFFLLTSNAFAVTDFDIEVRDSDGDYTSYATVESAFDVNLTDSVVLYHGGITGTIADGSSVEGATSGATGTAVHVTSTQIGIYGITGTFQNSEQIYLTEDSHYVTSSSASDDMATVITFYNDTTESEWDGGTYDAVNTITLRGDTTGDSELAWDGTITGGVNITGTGWCGFKTSDTYITYENIVVTCDNGACMCPSVNGAVNYINIIANGGGFQPSYVTGADAVCTNCYSYNSAGEGFNCHYASTFVHCYNCTSENATGTGFDKGGGNCLGYNLVAFDSADNLDFYQFRLYLGGGKYNEGDYHACSDTSCNDYVTNYITGLTLAEEIEGSGNPHLLSTSDLVDAGDDIFATSGIDYDIDNVTRGATWDIGADEYVSTEVVFTPWIMMF